MARLLEGWLVRAAAGSGVLTSRFEFPDLGRRNDFRPIWPGGAIAPAVVWLLKEFGVQGAASTAIAAIAACRFHPKGGGGVLGCFFGFFFFLGVFFFGVGPRPPGSLFWCFLFLFFFFFLFSFFFFFWLGGVGFFFLGWGFFVFSFFSFLCCFFLSGGGFLGGGGGGGGGVCFFSFFFFSLGVFSCWARRGGGCVGDGVTWCYRPAIALGRLAVWPSCPTIATRLAPAGRDRGPAGADGADSVLEQPAKVVLALATAFRDPPTEEGWRSTC